MKRLSKIPFVCGFYLVFVCNIFPCSAQQSLTTDDKREISYQAKMLIKEFEILLNVLSMKGTTLNESQIIINNSYTPSSTQIFTDSLIVVEDDIDPLHTTSRPADPPKSSIRDYLNALFLLYQKSDQPSIEFSNIKSSSVNKRDYVYVQVLYDSEFNNKHKEVSKAYQPTKRIAEVRADFINNNWQTQIVSITYWNDNQTFNDTVYTTEATALLASLKNETVSDVQLTASSGVDTANTLAMAEDRIRYENYMKARMDSMAKKYYEEYYDRIRKREERERKEMEAQYNTKMNSYRVAMDNGNYEQAKMALEEATPFATASQKAQVENEMIRVKRIISDRARMKRERLQDAQSKAKRFRAMKYYEEAIQWYEAALQLDPSLFSYRDSVAVMRKMKAMVEPYITKLNQRKYDEVIKDLNREIKGAQSIVDYYFIRGMANELEGKTRKAFNDYNDAIEGYSNFRDAYIYRGNLYLKEQEKNNAIADFGMALAIYDQDTALLLKRARLNMEVQQPEKAIEDLSKAISVFSSNSDWYMQRGKLYRNSQKYTLALNDFAQAATLTPDDPQTWYFKGLAYIDLQDIYGAAAEFERARSLNLDQVSLQNIRNIANSLYEKGMASTQRNAHTEAIEIFNGAIALDPTFKEAWFAMGEARMAVDDPLSAIANFTEAIELDNRYYEAFYQRGMARVNNNQLSLAAQDFDEAGKISPSYIQAHMKSGETYTSMEEWDRAVRAYQRALSVNPEDASIHLNMGLLYMNMGNYQRAISSLDKAIDINKEYPEAYYHRGLAYVNAKNTRSAESDFSDAVKYKPNYAEAYYERGKIYLYTDNKTSDAIDDFSSAIRAKSNYVEALLERGKAHFEEKSFTSALTDLNNAVSLQGNLLDDQLIRYQLGYSNLHAKQIQKAREHLIIAQTSEGGNQAEITLGLAYCDLLEKKFDSGYTLMEEALQKGNFSKKDLKKNSLSASIKKDKRFKNLLKQYL